jgi:hypothetical protein
LQIPVRGGSHARAARTTQIATSWRVFPHDGRVQPSEAHRRIREVTLLNGKQKVVFKRCAGPGPRISGRLVGPGSGFLCAVLIGFEGTLELPPRFDLVHRSGLPNLRHAVVEQFAPSLLSRVGRGLPAR